MCLGTGFCLFREEGGGGVFDILEAFNSARAISGRVLTSVAGHLDCSCIVLLSGFCVFVVGSRSLKALLFDFAVCGLVSEGSAMWDVERTVWGV